MTENRIRDRLVKQGEKLIIAPVKFYNFTGTQEADKLLNDLTKYPHAFVLASIMDQQIKAERAWLIPYQLKRKLGNFKMRTLLSLSAKDVHRLMTKPKPLHRYNKMSKYLFSGIQRIAEQYKSDASRIWLGKPSSADVIYRFLEFEGVGPKIATMAANILARDFKIQFSDYSSIDISVDVHIRRVFRRLQLCPENAEGLQFTYKARALHPEFPGIMDLPCWEIGRQWCKPGNPECQDCYMSDLCPSANLEINPS